MTAPITFRPAGAGREVALIGVIAIAEVAEQGLPGSRAWARIALPGVTTGPIATSSLEGARQVVRDKLADWLDAAGLAPCR